MRQRVYIPLVVKSAVCVCSLGSVVSACPAGGGLLFEDHQHRRPGDRKSLSVKYKGSFRQYLIDKVWKVRNGVSVSDGKYSIRCSGHANLADYNSSALQLSTV